MKKYIILISIIFFISCKNEKLTIAPIDKAFNDAGRWEFQYYEISNYEHLSDKDLLSKLEYFVNNKYPHKTLTHNDLFVFFYKKSLFINYKKYLYEMTIENNEFGGIDEFRENLVAKIIYRKIDDNKKEYTRIIYNNDNPENMYTKKLVKKDTIFEK